MFRSTITGRTRRTIPSFRKLAIGAWRPVNDPTTYAELTVNVEKIQHHLNNLNAQRLGSTQHNSIPISPITMTHFWVKVIALCLAEYPEINVALTKSRLRQRSVIDIFVTTLIRDTQGIDLSGITLHAAHLKSLGAIADEASQKIADLKSGQDQQIARVRRLFKWLPIRILPLVMGVLNWWVYTCNRSIEWMGFPGDRFGSAILSPFGAFGVQKAYVPLYPFSRTPYAIGIGKAAPMPIVENGELKVTLCAMITFTFDHRVIDGFQGAKILRFIQKIAANPIEMEYQNSNK